MLTMGIPLMPISVFESKTKKMKYPLLNEMFGNCVRIIRSGIYPEAVAKIKLNSSRIFGFVGIDREWDTIIYIV